MKRILYRGLEAESEEVDLTPAPGGRIEYTVLIFPADSELARRTDYRRVRMVRPDEQGRFRAEHLASGEYLAAAVVDADMQDGLEPEILDGLRQAARPFRLREGETATLSLTLAPVP